MLGFSVFVCILALADPKGAYKRIGKNRLDLPLRLQSASCEHSPN